LGFIIAQKYLLRKATQETLAAKGFSMVTEADLQEDE